MKSAILFFIFLPQRIREQRKDYRFLTTYLNKKNIPFRWIIPAGILVTWKEKRTKIDTLSKAQHFYEQIGGPEDEISSRDELETSSQEELQSKAKEEEEEKEKERRQETTVQEGRGAKTRSQTRTEEG
uniref:Uncharacterized protein n=2 Tax=Micrurus TaxID=8634 RepID=A0A2D4EZD6_MICCO